MKNKSDEAFAVLAMLYWINVDLSTFSEPQMAVAFLLGVIIVAMAGLIICYTPSKGD